MRLIPISIFLFAGIIFSTPHAKAALSANDFYCREIPVQPPSYFKSHVPTCADGKAAPTATAVCVENAFCTYVTDETKNTEIASADGSKKKFRDLPAKERSKYLIDSLEPSDWLPSSISCAKKSPAGSTECPPLDKCKGDINYKWYPASYSPEKMAEYMTTPAQNSGAFQNSDEGEENKAGLAK